MHSSRRLFLGRAKILSIVAASYFVHCANILSSTTNAAPAITRQPAGAVTGVGDSFLFNIEASGTPPLSYQWFFDGSPLTDKTNANLLLTSLTLANSGIYSAIVTNSSGSATSAPAVLTVIQEVPRRLGTGRVIKVGSQVGVPITFRASGRETNVSFSLSYSNSYSNPTFVAATNVALVNVNLTQPGTVGVSVSLPPGKTFPVGNAWLGMLQFDLAGTDPLQGRLAFTTNPVPITTVDAGGTGLTLSAAVQPQFVLATTNRAQLSLQSGLFEEHMVVSNPSDRTMTNVNIFALTFMFDTRTNLITLFNATAAQTALPYGDPLLDTPCNCDCGYFLDSTSGCDFSSYLNCGAVKMCNSIFSGTGFTLPFAQLNNLPPGESRALTLEFYVSDHVTVPKPSYSIFVADPVFRFPPVNTTSLMITTNRYVNGTFLVEFPTMLNRLYYVQYASNMNALATNPLTALPAINGTGSRVQWIDNGPPKTESPPVNNSRFYRVLETQ